MGLSGRKSNHESGLIVEMNRNTINKKGKPATASLHSTQAHGELCQEDI